MNNSAETTIQNATSLAKASKIISCVSDAVKDVTNNLPEFTNNQASVIKSAAGVLCVGGIAFTVRVVTEAKYSLKISKNDGIVLSPSAIKTA